MHKCTNINKHAVAAGGKTISHEVKPHNGHTFCCMFAGFLVRSNEAGLKSNGFRGESRDKHMYCAPLMCCSPLCRLIFLHVMSSHHYILPSASKHYVISSTLVTVFDPDLICNAIPASVIKSGPFALLLVECCGAAISWCSLKMYQWCQK